MTDLLQSNMLSNTRSLLLKKELGATDRARLNDYLDDVREIERRIQRVEAQNTTELRELPEAPVGVPDSFEEHVKLMFDLQALAFMSDMTRVFSFKMGRDASGRVYPDSGTTRAFHSASHHGGREDRVLDFAKINTYHVGMVPYFLEKLKNTPEGDSNLLERSLGLYGSPMGDSNLHNHKRCPLFLAGHANGQLAGNRHVKAPDAGSDCWRSGSCIVCQDRSDQTPLRSRDRNTTHSSSSHSSHRARNADNVRAYSSKTRVQDYRNHTRDRHACFLRPALHSGDNHGASQGHS